ncbi:MAG: ATP cone domain-containing protein, partial [Oscillospiraceae bacterium]|nr:ATP cone domain-containing protein [Oscillospiraceae bacterium]
MITMIKKRDGREAPFNIEKIARAIYRAAQAVGGNDYAEAMELADKVCQSLSETIIGRNPSVEEVQDMVERVLIENGHAKTAKAYILYRAERTRAREMNTTLMKIYEDLTFKSAGEYDLKRENANIDGDTAMGTMLKYGSEGAKQFNELYVLDPVHSNAHINGDIHIH